MSTNRACVVRATPCGDAGRTYTSNAARQGNPTFDDPRFGRERSEVLKTDTAGLIRVRLWLVLDFEDFSKKLSRHVDLGRRARE